jgi:hypothetical protein
MLQMLNRKFSKQPLQEIIKTGMNIKVQKLVGLPGAGLIKISCVNLLSLFVT